MSNKFNVGDKVVPISKNIGCNLKYSYAWIASKSNGYMYVIEINPDVKPYNNIHGELVYICDVDNGKLGDYFLESDLIKYE